MRYNFTSLFNFSALKISSTEHLYNLLIFLITPVDGDLFPVSILYNILLLMPSFFTAVSISISAFSLFNLICDNINIATPPIYFLSLYVYIISLKVFKVKLNYTTKSGAIQSLLVIIAVNLNFSMIFLKFLLKLSQEVL